MDRLLIGLPSPFVTPWGTARSTQAGGTPNACAMRWRAPSPFQPPARPLHRRGPETAMRSYEDLIQEAREHGEPPEMTRPELAGAKRGTGEAGGPTSPEKRKKV